MGDLQSESRGLCFGTTSPPFAFLQSTLPFRCTLRKNTCGYVAKSGFIWTPPTVLSFSFSFKRSTRKVLQEKRSCYDFLCAPSSAKTHTKKTQQKQQKQQKQENRSNTKRKNTTSKQETQIKSNKTSKQRTETTQSKRRTHTQRKQHKYATGYPRGEAGGAGRSGGGVFGHRILEAGYDPRGSGRSHKSLGGMGLASGSFAFAFF